MKINFKKEQIELYRSILIVLFVIIIIGVLGSRTEKSLVGNTEPSSNFILSETEIASKNGVELPIKWGDLGAKMVEAGAIDSQKFESIYASQGGLTETEKEMLYGNSNKNIVITPENSGFILNMLWGFGLSNKNPILEEGEMSNPKYGGAQGFASTGGWTISSGDPMSHYSMHQFIALNPDQQMLVDRVSSNIYRPCCGNSTHFPDCNHGMAMLGLLEIMASQGISEQDMYRVALIVNSYWFPDTYEVIKSYKESKGIEWKDVDPKEVLGFDYSSGKGYQNIASQVIQPKKQQGGGGCSI